MSASETANTRHDGVCAIIERGSPIGSAGLLVVGPFPHDHGRLPDYQELVELCGVINRDGDD